MSRAREADRKSADLDVCKACGWYAHGQFRPGECDPLLGKVADELAAQAKQQGIVATKLGYGTARLTFEIDDHTHVTVQPHHDGTFTVHNVWMIGEALPSDVLAIVMALKSIRSRAR